jgi:radical SAM protein with 4Fe4S-binding SPASM domain
LDKADIVFLSKITEWFTWRRILNVLMVSLGHWLSSILKRPLVWGMPYVATVEPTNQCNLICKECPTGQRQSSTRKAGYISVEDYERTLKEISDTAFYLMLYFQGEPLLHKSLPHLIEKAKQKRMFVITSTNAHFLDDSISHKLITSGLDQLIVSVDGTTQETYEAYRKGGHLHLVKENLISIVKLKQTLQSRTPFITVQFLVTSENEHEMEELKFWKNQLGFDEIRFKSLQIYDFNHGMKMLPKNKKYQRYKQKNNKDWVLKKKIKNCSRLWHTLVVNHQMKVLPCCYDKFDAYTMGDLKTARLKELWLNEAFQSFRMEALRVDNKIDICRNCIG